MKNILTISRYWNNPKIITTISSEEISLQMDLDDFCIALKQEIGSIATTFTQKAFAIKFDNAIAIILKRVKEESIKTI